MAVYDPVAVLSGSTVPVSLKTNRTVKSGVGTTNVAVPVKRFKVCDEMASEPGGSAKAPASDGSVHVSSAPMAATAVVPRTSGSRVSAEEASALLSSFDSATR